MIKLKAERPKKFERKKSKPKQRNTESVRLRYVI